jgi:hypothetical protein
MAIIKDTRGVMIAIGAVAFIEGGGNGVIEDFIHFIFTEVAIHRKAFKFIILWKNLSAS